MKALIVVDMQNDFLTGSLVVPGGVDLIDPINNMARLFDAHGDIVIATMDWHEPTNTHFSLNGGAWPSHCIQKTYGADLAVELPELTHIILKGEHDDGYSGFSGHVKGSSQSLFGLLDEYNVNDIYVCGVALDYCVGATAQEAREVAPTKVIIDLVRSVNLHPGDTEKKLTELRDSGVDISTSVHTVLDLNSPRRGEGH